MHGIDQYDPTRGVKLITYVTHHIDGHLRHYLRDRTQIIKEPAWLQEMAQKVRREAETLTQELGREPTDGEVAQSLGLNEAEVARIRATRAIFAVQSLDEAQETARPVFKLRKATRRRRGASCRLKRKSSWNTRCSGSKRSSRRSLYSFYYEDRSQTDIAKALGVSNNYVSHILKNSARKLQQMFRSDAVREAALQHERQRRRLAAHGPIVMAEEADETPPTIVDPVTGLYTRALL